MKVECSIKDSWVQFLFDEKLVQVKGTYEGKDLLINYDSVVHHEYLTPDDIEPVMDAIKAFNNSNDEQICIVDD